MRLTDRLQPVDAAGDATGAVMAAHVGTTAAGYDSNTGPDGPVLFLVEQLRALVRPDSRAVNGQLYRWRDSTYRQAGHPIVRRRGGRDHHYTLTLERID